MLASPDEDASSLETSHTAQNGQATVDKCDCPEQVVPRKAFKATFTGLKHKEKYFPMISRSEPQAFFGLAPAAVRPTGLVRAPPASPTHIRTSPAENALPTNQQHLRDTLNGGNEGLYDASSNGGREFMDVDMPHPSPSTHTLVIESESDPDGRDDIVQSRSASPVNPPQMRRRPVTIRVRVRNNSKLAFDLIVMIHFNS